MFWAWFLKYSSFVITGIVSLFVGVVLHWLTTRRSDLVYYTSHPQGVQLPPPPQPANQVPAIPNAVLGTFILFLFNQGRAPARNVHVGHFWLPANSVFPDIPRDVAQTPGGGTAIRFPIFPARTLISITYGYAGVFQVNNIISYVGSEDGPAKHIPVMLQRIWPQWWLKTSLVIWLLGVWVVVNFLWTLTEFLWRVYYVGH